MTVKTDSYYNIGMSEFYCDDSKNWHYYNIGVMSIFTVMTVKTDITTI